jgi:serine/threonine protein kinase
LYKNRLQVWLEFGVPEDQIRSAEPEHFFGTSQVFRNHNGSSHLSILVNQAARTDDTLLSGWQYKPGDIIKNAWGNVEFTFRQQLGRGMYGEVHVVHHEYQGQTCSSEFTSAEFERSRVNKERALKCIKLDSMTREQRLSLFLPLCEEALLGAKLGTHPHIIALRSAASTEEQFLVVMDLVQDARGLNECYQDNSLWKTVDGGMASWQGKPPSSKITVVLAMLWHQLLSALDHLHGLNIVHSDVKPENVLLNTDTLHLHLIDMGLAREGRKTFGGVLEFDCDGCTPAYAGPEVIHLFEQFTDGMPSCERKWLQKQNPIEVSSHDLWAAALTIFEAVHSNRDSVWCKGNEGSGALAVYWGEFFMGLALVQAFFYHRCLHRCPEC